VAINPSLEQVWMDDFATFIYDILPVEQDVSSQFFIENCQGFFFIFLFIFIF
jgi:hypothetical protein